MLSGVCLSGKFCQFSLMAMDVATPDVDGALFPEVDVICTPRVVLDARVPSHFSVKLDASRNRSG
jgi:hypothetical protein